MNNRPKDNPDDRAQYLRDFMKYPITKDDIVTVTREMARLLIALNDDMAALPEIRSMMASTQKLVIDFMQDQLTYRLTRQEAELKNAEAQRAKAAEDLTRTSQKIKAIKLTGQTGIPMQMLPPVVLYSWDWWRTMFAERVLPNAINFLFLGIVVIVLNALWTYFKTQIAIP